VIGVMVAVIAVIGAVVLAFVPLGGGGSGGSGGGGSDLGLPEQPDTVVPEPTVPDPTFADPTFADPTDPDPTYADPEPSPTQLTYQVVDAPGGMSVSVPSSWSVHAGASSTNVQADDPDADCFLRFGGGKADPRPLGTVVSGFERTTPSIQTGYQRLQLSSVAYGQAQAAVDWEFTFSSDTGPRHAYGRYWRTGGTDYVVYASCAVDDWSEAEQPLSTMFDTASPQ
jgi:hypothetical protein